MRWNRSKIRTVIRILLGHCLQKKHAKRIGTIYKDLCRYCEDIRVAEDIAHILYEVRVSGYCVKATEDTGQPLLQKLEDATASSCGQNA